MSRLHMNRDRGSAFVLPNKRVSGIERPTTQATIRDVKQLKINDVTAPENSLQDYYYNLN